MYAKLGGRILTGKLAEVFVKKGIAIECDVPVKKGRPAKKEAKAPVKKAKKKK
jgi:hypothetical protein